MRIFSFAIITTACLITSGVATADYYDPLDPFGNNGLGGFNSNPYDPLNSFNPPGSYFNPTPSIPEPYEPTIYVHPDGRHSTIKPTGTYHGSQIPENRPQTYSPSNPCNFDYPGYRTCIPPHLDPPPLTPVPDVPGFEHFEPTTSIEILAMHLSRQRNGPVIVKNLALNTLEADLEEKNRGPLISRLVQFAHIEQRENLTHLSRLDGFSETFSKIKDAILGDPDAEVPAASVSSYALYLQLGAKRFRKVRPGWQKYLDLPIRIFSCDTADKATKRDKLLKKYAHVAETEKYASIAALPAFETTRNALQSIECKIE